MRKLSAACLAGIAVLALNRVVSAQPAEQPDPNPAGADGFWARRLTLSLASGPTLPTWSESRIMTGGRFTANYGLPALGGRLAPELTSGAWVVLQDGPSGYEGPTVIYVMPGLRGRLLTGPLTPFASIDLGLTINRAAYVQGGVSEPGFGFDPTVGLEWAVAGPFELEAGVSYYVSTGVPMPHQNGDLGTAGFFVIGLGLGATIATDD